MYRDSSEAPGILGETSEKRYSETLIPSKVPERKKDRFKNAQAEGITQ